MKRLFQILNPALTHMVSPRYSKLSTIPIIGLQESSYLDCFTSYHEKSFINKFSQHKIKHNEFGSQFVFEMFVDESVDSIHAQGVICPL